MRNPAHLVTGLRCALTLAVAVALVADWPGLPSWAWWVALLAWALDAVDGRVARATRTVSEAGARFDMEADAALLVVLCLAAAPHLGWWVLAVAALRYLWVLASLILGWLRAPLPPRLTRRLIGALQGAALLAALVLPVGSGRVVVVAALGALLWSFARDVATLHRRSHTQPEEDTPDRQPAV